MSTLTLGQIRKAIGTGLAGVFAWATAVVASPSSGITAAEWLVLGGVGLAVAACFGLTNDPAPIPAPAATDPTTRAPETPAPVTPGG